MRLVKGVKRRRLLLSEDELLALCRVFGIEEKEVNIALVELSKKFLSIEEKTKEIMFPEIILSKKH